MDPELELILARRKAEIEVILARFRQGILEKVLPAIVRELAKMDSRTKMEVVDGKRGKSGVG